MRQVSLFMVLLLSGAAYAAPDQLIAQGEQLFRDYCDICHAATVHGSAQQSLERKYQGRLPAKVEDRTDLKADYITDIVRGRIPPMTGFRPTEISDLELQALIAYLRRNSRD